MSVHLGQYSVYLEPLAKVGENLYVAKEGLNYSGYYRIKYIEPLPEMILQLAVAAPNGFGVALAAGVASPAVMNTVGTRTAQLNQRANTFAIFEIELLDDFNLLIFQPPSDGKYVGQYATWNISLATAEPQLRRFAIFEDREFAFVAQNPTALPITSFRINFKGYKYLVEKLSSVPDKWTALFTEVEK